MLCAQDDGRAARALNRGVPNRTGNRAGSRFQCAGGDRICATEQAFLELGKCIRNHVIATFIQPAGSVANSASASKHNANQRVVVEQPIDADRRF